MNFGTKIVIALVIFIVFILSLGFMMMNANKETPEDNYYEKDLRYEQEIQAQKNAATLSEKVNFKVSENKTLTISFPNEVKDYQGEVNFIRPDNAKDDKVLPLSLSEKNEQILDIQDFRKGLWKVQVKWKMNNKEFQTQIFEFVK
ncbi:MAG: FixH family protein [Thermonemataceae bacterium]|nr:FixH family protein [Thermonemataceae bacterium]